MSRRQVYRRRLCILLAVSLFFIMGYYFTKVRYSIPDYVRIEEGNSYSFDTKAAVKCTIQKKTAEQAADNMKMNIDRKMFDESEVGSYVVEYRLFGVWKLKNVTVDVVQKEMLIPCGFPAGIYIETEGVMVIGTGEVHSVGGEKLSPAENILKSGDYIVKVNEKSVSSKEQFMEEISRSNGKEVILEILRNRESLRVKLCPVQIEKGEYKLGVWVRDNTQGVGMLTYIDEKGFFGALGHGITDMDTGLLMDIKGGKILRTDILSVVKGKKGDPGELIGVIDYGQENEIGEITGNTSCGIFGTMSQKQQNYIDTEAMPVAMKQDVKTGAAILRSCIDGSVEEYAIEILNVNISEKNQNKGLVIEVTDERLLNKTGGIVQGMSGSPIIQNGCIIGAVTHVFVQDSTKGYGIFIENMLSAR